MYVFGPVCEGVEAKMNAYFTRGLEDMVRLALGNQVLSFLAQILIIKSFGQGTGEMARWKRVPACLFLQRTQVQFLAPKGQLTIVSNFCPEDTMPSFGLW